MRKRARNGTRRGTNGEIGDEGDEGDEDDQDDDKKGSCWVRHAG